GNACNNNGQTDGDRAAGTNLDVIIDGPPAPPPDASAPPVPPPKAPAPVDDAGPDATTEATPSPGVESSGCAMAWNDRPGTVPGALAAALGALVVLARRARSPGRLTARERQASS